MKERTALTVYRTIDVPVFVTDVNGEHPTSKIDQSSVTFTVFPEEAELQVSRLGIPDAVLEFTKGKTLHLIPVRHVVHIERYTYIPNPSTVELLETPDGTLYLGRTDEDAHIVYPADFERDRDTDYPVEDGALGVMGYPWVEEGDDPTTVSGVQPMPRPAGLTRVATFSNGKVYPIFAERETEDDPVEIIAGPAARQYIGETAISKRLADHQL